MHIIAFIRRDFYFLKETLIKGEAIVSDTRKSVTESVVKQFNQRFLNSQNATALAAATFSESTLCCMGMRTV